MQGPTKFDDWYATPTPAAVGQWVKGKKYMYECQLVATTAKDIPVSYELISSTILLTWEQEVVPYIQ